MYKYKFTVLRFTLLSISANLHILRLFVIMPNTFTDCEVNQSNEFTIFTMLFILTGDTRKIFVSNIKTVDESHSVRVLIGCKPIIFIL